MSDDSRYRNLIVECPSLRVSSTGKQLGNIYSEGAKRLFKCFEGDSEFTQAVCENGTWTTTDCFGRFNVVQMVFSACVKGVKCRPYFIIV